MRVLIVALLSVGLTHIALAQRFNGYIHSDFSGVLGARLQPASIADSPYKYDISLINGNFFLSNNIAFYDKSREEPIIARYLDNQRRFVQANASVGGFSFMMALPRKQSIAFNFSIRSLISINNATPELITRFNRFNNPFFQGLGVVGQRIDYASSVWQEFGFTYARVIRDDGFNRWKVGATLKGINSYGATFIDLDDFSFSHDIPGQLDLNRIQADLGYSSNLDDFDFFDGENNFSGLPRLTGLRPALDIGVVFERIASRENPKADNGTNLEADIDYEFRVSASITDIASMRFDQGSASTRFSGLVPNLQPFDIDDKLGGFSSVRELVDSLSTIANAEELPDKFTMSLPTALNVNYDYNFGNNFFFNVNGLLDLSSISSADYRLNYLSSITVTPRWEINTFGLYLPVYMNRVNTTVGLAARMGPLTLGANDLSLLFSNGPSAAGFFFSLNISKLVANSSKPYCFGASRGSATTRLKRTPIYKRKKFLFF